MQKKKTGLLFRFGIIFLILILVTLIISGVATYVTQSRIFQEEEEKNLRAIADYLATVLEGEGDNFPMYQKYLVSNIEEPDIPVEFTEEDARESMRVFEKMFAEAYPGKILGEDVQPEDMPEELRKAYAKACHEHYLLLFEKAAEKFGIAYTYYVVPTGEDLHMYYMLDGVREYREDGFLNLCDDIYEPLEEHQKMWEAWNTGGMPQGFDSYDNEYGKTYAWYVPLHLNGEKLGLIGTEVEITDYNRAIAANTARQLAAIAVILVLAAAVTLWVIDRRYIAKIRKLSRTVSDYAQNKDASVAGKLEGKGTDELSSLMSQTSDMILEMDNYMKSLVETTEELSYTRERVDVEAKMARKDALTGIRNRNAYEEEVRRLDGRLRGERSTGDRPNDRQDGRLDSRLDGQLDRRTKFGFAVVDVNFLKRINDTYGHEFGNITIKECCSLVCRVFSHSPVFRIGGDEFAVILENEDYEHVDERVAEFNLAQEKEKEKEEPWKQVSAAIGYALYDEAKDGCVEDVFKRADAAMYKRKREMKAGGCGL